MKNLIPERAAGTSGRSQMKRATATCSRSAWAVFGVLLSCNSMSDEAFAGRQFYSYASHEPGCTAEPDTAVQLLINADGKQWVIIAPARVVSTARERPYGGEKAVPLDVEIAQPLELALQKRIGDLQTAGTDADPHSSVIRLKIVSVWHGVLGLGMGTAVAQIALRFNICVDGDLPESAAIRQVAKNGPKMNTLWHQPKGEELRASFQAAADEAINAVADSAFRLATGVGP